MNLKLITDLDEILKCREDWDGVAGARPFFSWSWLASWLQSQVEDLSPAIVVGLDESQRWVGIAPFCIDNRSTPFGRKLRLLGSGKTCSDYNGLISDDQHFRSFAELVADWLTEKIRPGLMLESVDIVELEGISPEDKQSQYFSELLEASGFKSHTVELGCWAVDLPSTWEELNKNFSKSLRRKTKKAVQRLGDGETVLLSSDQHKLERLWPMFVDLHQKRRKMLGQPGCFL